MSAHDDHDHSHNHDHGHNHADSPHPTRADDEDVELTTEEARFIALRAMLIEKVLRQFVNLRQLAQPLINLALNNLLYG